MSTNTKNSSTLNLSLFDDKISKNSMARSQKFRSIHNLQTNIQLQQARNHIRVLQNTNQALLAKIQLYEDKLKKMSKLQAELDFYRQTQKQIKEQLINSQEINKKLSLKIQELESKQQREIEMVDQSLLQQIPYYKKQLKINLGISPQKQTSNDNISIFNHSTQNMKQNNSQKRSHLLTPKSKMKISCSNISEQEISSFQKINARRRVFLQGYI